MPTDAPTARALDLSHLERQTGRDRDLERELLALFLQQCLRLAPILAGAGAPIERADAAHTLKGAALAVGAGRIASLADRLEGALDGDWPEEAVSRLLVKLERAIDEARRDVAARWRAAAA